MGNFICFYKKKWTEDLGEMMTLLWNRGSTRSRLWIVSCHPSDLCFRKIIVLICIQFINYLIYKSWLLPPIIPSHTVPCIILFGLYPERIEAPPGYPHILSHQSLCRSRQILSHWGRTRHHRGIGSTIRQQMTAPPSPSSSWGTRMTKGGAKGGGLQSGCKVNE